MDEREQIRAALLRVLRSDNLETVLNAAEKLLLMRDEDLAAARSNVQAKMMQAEALIREEIGTDHWRRNGPGRVKIVPL